ncbi:MAG: RnfABCDGE type electron transport complex subunit B [Candidatus Accumulibacter phosphatis]|jgi:electron transport complex protein RnfB|uniref:RnfABCDGE type electron transport complex subunit B n=1 Tax=Candidatus Accumulibacter sp. ACC012 TaxID=2823332 RepID=UPI0025C64EFE|nr:RnfABCDGE type electron transport complex subunit B [Candidatus Accumulibacter sp. ACC012]
MIAILSLTVLGAILGIILGIANRLLKVESNPLEEELLVLLPGSNCGQCGFAGCAAAAAAIATAASPSCCPSEGKALASCCPPGGKRLATTLAARLGITLDLAGVADDTPKIAVVVEELCIGCCRCSKVCPTDAILGASRQIHNVLREACTGCENCVDSCPTEALAMRPVLITLQHWVMPRPLAA